MIELEQFFEQDATERRVPLVTAQNVERQEGLVLVRNDKTLRVDSTIRRGLVQVDPDDLPEGLKEGEWTMAYRFSTLPYELVLSLGAFRSVGLGRFSVRSA